MLFLLSGRPFENVLLVFEVEEDWMYLKVRNFRGQILSRFRVFWPFPRNLSSAKVYSGEIFHFFQIFFRQYTLITQVFDFPWTFLQKLKT